MEKKSTRWVKQFTVWGVLGCGLILAVLTGILWFYIEMPMNVNRDLSNELPWKNEGLEVAELVTAWKDAGNHPILSKRTRLYPEAAITLTAAPGKGRIDVIFLNPDGTQVGDTHNLNYADGQFIKRQDRISVAEGNKATVWLESGYPSRDHFMVHHMNMQENLWRVVLIHRPEKSNKPIRLGQRSIKAEIIPGEKKK